MKKYVESRSGSTASIPEKNDTCFRLNNYQFLVNENTEGIYFYDAKRSTYGKDIPGLRMYTEIKQEFTGGNHKHYALIYSSNTNFRYSDLYQKYEILSLIAGNSENPTPVMRYLTGMKIRVPDCVVRLSLFLMINLPVVKSVIKKYLLNMMYRNPGLLIRIMLMLQYIFM